MLPGQTLIVRCDSLKEWDSARRIVYNVKKEKPRGDGYSYEVNQSKLDLSISVTLVPGVIQTQTEEPEKGGTKL